MNLQNTRYNDIIVERKVEMYFDGQADSCESYSFVPEHAAYSSDSVLTINNRVNSLISKENKFCLQEAQLHISTM
jgi:hypothetical protein